MTRRDLFHKWLIYALGLLPVWLLDAYLLPRYPLFGVTPMLLPLAVAAVWISLFRNPLPHLQFPPCFAMLNTTE